MSQRVLCPHRCGPPGGVQNSIFSIKNQLNFQVTFKCNFEPYLAQLGSNLAPTWTPKSFQNWSQNDAEMQLPEKLIFATPPIRNARFCFPKGLQKRPKMHSKTTCYTSAFSTSKKHPPSFDFAPTWLHLGPPKTPPRSFQGLLKITLGGILGHLGCKFDFWPPWGYPWAQFSSIFDQNLMFFESAFV